MHGTFDPRNSLGYTIAGADVSGRFHRTQVRAEYLVRRQEFTEDPRQMFKDPITGTGRDHFDKHGYYLELEQPLTDGLSLFARADGLFRRGNVLADSPLTTRSVVFRYTGGLTVLLQPGFRLKLSGEGWAFSDRFPDHQRWELSIHLGVVGTF